MSGMQSRKFDPSEKDLAPLFSELDHRIRNLFRRPTELGIAFRRDPTTGSRFDQNTFRSAPGGKEGFTAQATSHSSGQQTLY